MEEALAGLTCREATVKEAEENLEETTTKKAKEKAWLYNSKYMAVLIAMAIVMTTTGTIQAISKGKLIAGLIVSLEWLKKLVEGFWWLSTWLYGIVPTEASNSFIVALLVVLKWIAGFLPAIALAGLIWLIWKYVKEHYESISWDVVLWCMAFCGSLCLSLWPTLGLGWPLTMLLLTAAICTFQMASEQYQEKHPKWG